MSTTRKSTKTKSTQESSGTPGKPRIPARPFASRAPRKQALPSLVSGPAPELAGENDGVSNGVDDEERAPHPDARVVPPTENSMRTATLTLAGPMLNPSKIRKTETAEKRMPDRAKKSADASKDMGSLRPVTDRAKKCAASKLITSDAKKGVKNVEMGTALGVNKGAKGVDEETASAEESAGSEEETTGDEEATSAKQKTTAIEKERLLLYDALHPDYREDQHTELTVQRSGQPSVLRQDLASITDFDSIPYPVEVVRRPSMLMCIMRNSLTDIVSLQPARNEKNTYLLVESADDLRELAKKTTQPAASSRRQLVPGASPGRDYATNPHTVRLLIDQTTEAFRSNVWAVSGTVHVAGRAPGQPPLTLAEHMRADELRDAFLRDFDAAKERYEAGLMDLAGLPRDHPPIPNPGIIFGKIPEGYRRET